MDISQFSANLIDWFYNWLNATFGITDRLYAEVIISTLIFIGFIILGWIIVQVFEHYFLRWAKKTKTKLDDEILKNVKKPIYILVIFFGIFFLLENLSILDQYQDILRIVFVFLQVFLVAFIITRIINVFFAWYADRRARKKDISQHILFVFKAVINAIIYVIALFAILAILNIDLSGIALGGAVTAVVIGFALQSVLSDFFSAFSIYFDRPFEIGDFIVVGEYAGTVKKIGMKSTRVELLQGEELVLPNKELTSTSVRNFKKMNKRRITFTFGVTYDTPLKKLKKIPDIIKNIIDPDKLEYINKIDRVHFIKFADFSLNFEVVYYLKTKDYNKYMDTQQEINFAIKEAFEKEGIEMAFPTQTIFLEK